MSKPFKIFDVTYKPRLYIQSFFSLKEAKRIVRILKEQNPGNEYIITEEIKFPPSDLDTL